MTLLVAALIAEMRLHQTKLETRAIIWRIVDIKRAMAHVQNAMTAIIQQVTDALVSRQFLVAWNIPFMDVPNAGQDLL